MANHLIIGLGGTGGNIIRSFRKTVYQAFSSDLPPAVNVQYLYVDSSDEFMQPEDPSWKILGHSVQLPQRNQLLIQGMNLKNVIDNLNQYPGLKPWLGSREDWRDILNASDAAKVVGGQKRRLGRFLFATHASEFRQRVGEFVAEMQQDRSRGFAAEAATTFHVCCGLAGGTGSGALVDALCQIRAAFPDPQYRILVYALLPERRPVAGRAGPNYHANGYAALLELNALGVGSWHPHDVLATDGSRLALQDPFNCCYLFNDENEANVAVSLAELGDITASFLFQKIVQSPNVNWGKEGSPIQRQEIYEVGAQANFPETSPRGAPRRSRSFFSFGIKQIAYPEVEISEFLTYSFAQQVTRQLMFNRWVEGEGYKDEPVNQSFHEYVRDPATLNQWYLTDDRLTLSEGILPSEISNKNWKGIADFWKAIVPNYVTHVLDQQKGEVVKMLPELTRLAETVFREQYRGVGVANFYETKRRDMTDHVRELRARIERDLFSSWRTGDRSMYDIDRLVTALIESLEERLGAIDNRLAKVGEDSEVYKTNETKIGDNRKQWAKLGIVAISLGRHKNILNAQSEALITRYTLKTRVEGFRFARELVQRLIQDLHNLAAEIAKCKRMFNEAAAHFATALGSRLQDGADKDLSKQVVRKYDPEQVRRFTRDLITDRSLQRRQTSAARERLVLLLGERQTFAAFAARVSMANLEDTMSESCKAEAAAAHEDTVALNPERDRVLKVSLIDLLRREYETNEEELGRYARNIMNMARNYLKLDPVQRQLVKPGIPAANDPAQAICTTSVTIIMPEAPDAKAFRDRLGNLLQNARQSGSSRVVSNPTRPHEITIVSITNVFPARFIAVASFLKEQYENRLTGPAARRAFLELHSEGEDKQLATGETLYDLFAETYQAADMLPWLNLASALHLVQEGQDHETGRRQIKMITRDRFGLTHELNLGPDFDTVLQDADPSAREALEDEVRQALKTSFPRVDQREQLAADLLARLRNEESRLGVGSPRYKQEVAAYMTTRKILELEG
ncbi:MAG TPA: tubulin-like doman-containing protein [Acidobacteriaceae bacterium]|nr:tubulin-like doman-containing protein [Acidobacteriaceae bacterium]